MIITKPSTKHFHTEVFIENLEECTSKAPGLLLTIGEFEEEALRWVLGDCLFNEFKQQFEYSEASEAWILKSAVEDKWKWLLNGRDYEYDGRKVYACGCGCPKGNCKTLSFPGIIKTIKVSSTKSFEKNYLAYYIYYKWKTINETVSAGTGEQIPEVKNSATVAPKKKIYNAWNRFADWVDELNDFLNHHREFYPNASGVCEIKRLSIYDI